MPLSLAAEITISDVNFSGNLLIKDEQLETNIKSKPGHEYLPSQINRDIESIASLYSERGFFNINIFYPQLEFNDPESVSITFEIEENPEILLDTLFISGQNYISLEKNEKAHYNAQFSSFRITRQDH